MTFRILAAMLTATAPVFADADPHLIADPLAAEAALLTSGFTPAGAEAPPPPDPATQGEWGDVIPWTPHVPVTAATLPDGRLLTFASSERTTFPEGGPEFTYAAVWDPATGVFTEINNLRHNMFCGGTVMLPDGRVAINGGRNVTKLSSIFDYRTDEWEAMQSMNDPRWYNPSVVLPDGTIFTVSGTGGGDTAELWNAATGWRRLTGLDWSQVTSQPGYINIWHPFLTLAPNGKLFHFGPTDVMNWVTPTGSGTIAPSGQNIPGDHYPKEGAWAMYEEGRILVAGGGQNTAENPIEPGTGASTNVAYTVNLNGPTPVIAPAASMQYTRQFGNSVILPTGEVMVIGGNTTGVKYTDAGAILTPELWNPQTGTWRPLADMAIARTYHSTALLLPDGRVWSGGGGLYGTVGNHRDAQIYTPSALFAADGSPAVRPAIATGPDKVGLGAQFAVTATPGLTKFAFIRMSSQTHSYNSDLRYLSLPFTETAAGTYTLTGHANANVMVPGYWMLFGLNSSGAYSQAKIIQISLNPDVTVQSPGDQESVQGDPAQVQIQVAAPPAIISHFTATGLPAGLTIDPDTGIIAGTITAAPGDYWSVVLVTPSSGNSLTVSFNWKVVLPNLGTGSILRDFWINIPGTALTVLTTDTSYPTNPDGSDFLLSFEAATDQAEDFGQRLRGYLHPTVTGTYRFWIAAKDQSRLLLSSDATAANAVEIASVPTSSGLREWNNLPQQASAPVTLVAGRRYYIEALMKGGTGPDHLAVGWQPPGATTTEVISGPFLSPYHPELDPVAAWHLDEPTWNGTTNEVKEVIGNVTGIHGTSVNGAVTSGTAPALAGNPGTGRAGVFDGNNQRVNIPFNAALNPEDFTISAWVRPDTLAPTNYRAVAASVQRVGNATRGFGLYYVTPGGKWEFFTGGSEWSGLVGPTVIADQWTHVAATFHTTAIANGVHTGIRRLFINGVQVAQDTGTYVPVTYMPLLIGASDYSGEIDFFMIGNIDEVRLHPAALRPVDIAATMALRHRLPFSPTVTSPGPLADWRESLVSQVIQAIDLDGDPLTFTATGLPDGLSISQGSGIISGTPHTAGQFNVTVTATDPLGGNGSASFVWTIGENLTVTHATAPPSPAGTTVTLVATSSGGINPRYQWNFGDGSPETALSPVLSTTHDFPGPGRYLVTITATDDSGRIITSSFSQAIHAPLTPSKPTASSPICHEDRISGNDRIWVVNPDNDSVTVIDAVTRAKLAEITVGTAPRCLAVAPDGRIWVTNTASATISILSPDSFNVLSSIALPRGSRPFGIAFSPDNSSAYVALEDTGKLLKLDPLTGAQLASTDVGKNVRHLSIPGDSSCVYVSRFITPRLPGEETATITTSGHGGEVVVVDSATGGILRTLLLQHSEQTDSSISARGIPNYLGSAAISPDGLSAWVPSKQDNVKRGMLRDNQELNHEMSVRAIASRLNLTLQSEDAPARVDLDNAGVSSAIAFDPWGIYAFVALEANRAVAVVDVWNHREIFRFDAGRAPQGLAVSPDGNTLFVHNFMERSVSIHNITSLIGGISNPPPAPFVVPTVTTEKLTPQTLLGKQLFYDAEDGRLAMEGYLSCAVCHNDGGHDGRVWDFTGFGEGLRNTITLRGHGGTRQGPLHWTGNFDEVQDFDNQIRNFAGGLGLISGGSPHAPLAAPNAGRSSDLDAVAAYLQSLDKHGDSPQRETNGALTTAAHAGELVFRALDCASCHGGPEFTRSAIGNFPNIGTLKATSGNRLGQPLTGLDIPTLRGVWNTAPYLHDGSAATLEQAVTAHQGISVGVGDLTNLVAYLKSIDDLPANAPLPTTTFTGWAEVTPGATGDPTSNVDGDPFPDLLEFALGGLPDNPASPAADAVTQQKSSGVFTMLVKRPAGLSGLNWEVLTSGNLTSWTVAPAPLILPGAGNTEVLHFENLQNQPGITVAAGFARLRVTLAQPPP